MKRNMNWKHKLKENMYDEQGDTQSVMSSVKQTKYESLTTITHTQKEQKKLSLVQTSRILYFPVYLNTIKSIYLSILYSMM